MKTSNKYIEVKKSKKLSEVKKLQLTYAQNRALILCRTGMSGYEYNDMQFELGCWYAEKELGSDSHYIQLVLSSKPYWNWWKNHWSKRDKEFVEAIKLCLHTFTYYCFIYEKIEGRIVRTQQFLWSEKEFMQAYKKAHDLTLFSLYPHKVILEESYKKMIHHLIKTINISHVKPKILQK